MRSEAIHFFRVKFYEKIKILREKRSLIWKERLRIINVEVAGGNLCGSIYSTIFPATKSFPPSMSEHQLSAVINKTSTEQLMRVT